VCPGRDRKRGGGRREIGKNREKRTVIIMTEKGSTIRLSVTQRTATFLTNTHTHK